MLSLNLRGNVGNVNCQSPPHSSTFHSVKQITSFPVHTNILPSEITMLVKLTVIYESPLPIWNEWDFLCRQQYWRNRLTIETLVSC